jgi:hypothetical protein
LGRILSGKIAGFVGLAGGKPPRKNPGQIPGRLGARFRRVPILSAFPGFPVSQNADFQNRDAANPRGYAVSPVSRFSRFENEG